jgi:hypothetical protein
MERYTQEERDALLGALLVIGHNLKELTRTLEHISEQLGIVDEVWAPTANEYD